MTGRPVHVAVIDSGVSLPHPHIRTIAAGVTIAANGATSPNYFDRLGHGTTVAAATQERAPDADVLAVKVFDWELSAPGVDAEHELRWLSLAVADVTSLLARHLPANGRGSVTTAIEVLRQVQSEFSASDRSSGEPSP